MRGLEQRIPRQTAHETYQFYKASNRPHLLVPHPPQRFHQWSRIYWVSDISIVRKGIMMHKNWLGMTSYGVGNDLHLYSGGHRNILLHRNIQLQNSGIPPSAQQNKRIVSALCQASGLTDAGQRTSTEFHFWKWGLQVLSYLVGAGRSIKINTVALQRLRLFSMAGNTKQCTLLVIIMIIHSDIVQ